MPIPPCVSYSLLISAGYSRFLPQSQKVPIDPSRRTDKSIGNGLLPVGGCINNIHYYQIYVNISPPSSSSWPRIPTSRQVSARIGDVAYNGTPTGNGPKG